MKTKNRREYIKSLKVSIDKLNILKENGPETKVIIYNTSNKKPCVSCIILCYNSEHFLEDALRSLFFQDFNEPIEIIVAYDRGTTDGTLQKLISVFKENLPISKKIMVSILFHNNATEFRARALALKYARGEYMCFLDYDNRFYPSKFSKQISFMRENKLHFSFSSQEVITESGEKTGRILLEVPPDLKSVDRMLTSGFIDANEFIFDRYFYSKILLPSYNVLVDKVYDSSLSDYFIDCLAALSGNINYEGEVLGEYRFNKYSVTPRKALFTTKSFDKNAFLFSRYQTTLFAIIRANSALKITDKKLLFNYISYISGDSLGFTFHFPGKTLAKETDRLPIKMFKFGLSMLLSSVKLSFRYVVFKFYKISNLFRKVK